MKTLQECDFVTAANLLNVDVASIRAVDEVESKGEGFNSDGTPKILFERHKFSKYSGGKFDRSHPHISNKIPGGYGKYSEQHDRLSEASKLNRNAALMSASWGRYQIMGFNYEAAGFKDLQSFINAMFESETAQLMAFVNFIKSQNLQKHLQNRNWAKFAEGYNGSNYKINNYDVKLANAYKKYSK